MDSRDYRKQLDVLQRLRDRIVYDIEVQSKLADKHEKFLEIHSQATRYHEEVKRRVSYLKRLIKEIETCSVEYKNKRINFINDELTHVLSCVFPERQFKAELLINPNKKKPDLKVLLRDSKGNVRNPAISEGGCARDLTSFSIPASALTVNRSGVFIVDEALSNASAESKSNFQDILELLVERGMQLIIISQTSDLYEDLSHRQLCLKFDDSTEIVTEVAVEDYIGGNSNYEY